MVTAAGGRSASWRHVGVVLQLKLIRVRARRGSLDWAGGEGPSDVEEEQRSSASYHQQKHQRTIHQQHQQQ